MTDLESVAILGMLLGACREGKLPHGIISQIGKKISRWRENREPAVEKVSTKST